MSITDYQAGSISAQLSSNNENIWEGISPPQSQRVLLGYGDPPEN